LIFPLLSFFFSLTGLGYATYTDLRERVVSNKLNYFLLAIGLALHAALALIEGNYLIIAITIGVVIATFLGSYALWKLGVWAGGDVKLMTALAALNPFNPNILSVLGVKIELFASINYPIFPLTLFIFSLLATLPYAVLLGARGLMKRKDLQKQIAKELKKKVLQSLELAAIVVGTSTLLMFFNLSLWIVLPLLIAVGFVEKKKQLWIAIAAFAFALWQSPQHSIEWFAYLFAFFIVVWAFLKLFFVSREVLREEKKITELQEGEIPVESIYLRKGKAVRGEKIQIKTIINYFKNNNLAGLQNYLLPKGKEIISSRKARGLEAKEINELKKLVKEKKLEDKIEIKLSAPFVPAILIGYLLLNIVGDLFWNVIL